MDDPAERVGPDGQAWHAASLGEWEAAGVALGDGPAGPEVISGAIRSRPVSRLRRRKPARRRTGTDSLAWSEAVPPALSASWLTTAHSRPRAGLRASASRWWWPFYLLLCGPFLLAFTLVRRSRVRQRTAGALGRTAIPRTLLMLAAVTGIFVTVAASAELLHGNRTAAPAQVQPTATGSGSGTGEVAETQPPSEAVPTQVASAVPVGARVLVANTDGQGLYLRRRPDWVSKWVAWSEGTNLQVLAAGVSGTGAPSASGAAWLQVRDPDGRVGYVPEQYVALAPSP